MKQINIAIIDSGICPHIDIPESAYANKINFSGPAFNYGDCTGHGTHMVGIIHKASPLSKLHILKVLNEKNIGDDYDFIRALAWCIENKIDIINISATNLEIPPEPTHEFIKYAYDQGIIIVAAGGNNQKVVCYPAKYPEVIGVTSCDKSKNISSFGYVDEGIDIAVCGENINSTWLGNQYRTMSGTSQSTAIITGLIADIKRKYEFINSKNIKEYLKKEYVNTLNFFY